mmetsp:Transcript_12613/g.37197  ORF Transcript_12613/g.37197 Transcript_12613/m.37197 type:complete len:158 (+) Transcript_12613:1081-1554(+)
MAIGCRSVLPGRNVEWIKKNGKCLDRVYPAPSSIRQVGYGAFASRGMSEGEVVVPIPAAVQITDRTTLHVYKRERYTNGDGNEANHSFAKQPCTEQLLLNYCFGHCKSSVRLCPASNANLINHCSRRMKERVGQCDPSKGPNAMLRWATDFDPETSD